MSCDSPSLRIDATGDGRDADGSSGLMYMRDWDVRRLTCRESMSSLDWGHSLDAKATMHLARRGEQAGEFREAVGDCCPDRDQSLWR